MDTSKPSTVLQLPERPVSREDFQRIVEFIEATVPDESARRRMGIGIARKLAGHPRQPPRLKLVA